MSGMIKSSFVLPEGKKIFSAEEIMLTHYFDLSESAKKEVRKYFIKCKGIEKISNAEADLAIKNHLIKIRKTVPFPGPLPGKEKFTFIDLFAGIGGFRMALQDLGGRCIFSSEWDKYSQQSYRANYGDIPFGDITLSVNKEHIPTKIDMLCAGFPCQPFSIAGISKKNSLGRKHGFQDEKQGNLFFHILDIIENYARPKVFLLENVKNLISHDKGNTFKVIKESLEALDYSFNSKIIDARHFVPQHRERTIMVGFDKRKFGKNISFDFNNIKIPEAKPSFREILSTDKVDSKYTLTPKLWDYLQEYAKKHKAKGNGFGFGLVDLNGISRTISARYYKDGAEILIPQQHPLNIPRRLTPYEAAALMGYPVDNVNPKKNYRIVVSDMQAYKQFGNSVVMPLIKAVGKEIVATLTKNR